jgi:hypothetical protein
MRDHTFHELVGFAPIHHNHLVVTVAVKIAYHGFINTAQPQSDSGATR